MEQVCGLKLTTCGVIVGVLYAIGSLVGIWFSIESTVRIFEANKTTIRNDINIKGIICCTLVLYSSICFTTSVLLVIGSLKNRHKLIAPWLINTFCLLFLNVCYLIFIFLYILLRVFAYESFDGFLVHLIILSWSLAIQIPIYNYIRNLYVKCRATQGSAIVNT